MTTELAPLSRDYDATGTIDFLRSRQSEDVVRVAGMPVRSSVPNSPHYDGFVCLDAFVVGVIEDAIKQVSRILSQGHCTRIILSYNRRNKFGGTNLAIAQPVRDLIVQKLLDVAAKHRVSVLPTIYVGPQQEGDLMYMYERNTRSLIVFEETVEAFDSHYNAADNRYGASWDEPA